MIKATLLYKHPTDPEAFEKYYQETHLPIAANMKDVEKLELTKFLSTQDAGKPEYYRMAELYFTDPMKMQSSMASPEGQAAVADLPNFATGGVTILVGSVEQ